MFSLFSLSAPLSGLSEPHTLDLQLLSDEEILKVWYQSQIIIGMLGEKETPSGMAEYYTHVVEQELQNRCQLQPNVFFKSAYKQKINDTNTLTAPE